MAFDWNSFTTNFLNTISTGINQRVEAQKDEKDLLDEEYKQAQVVFKNRKKLVNNGIMLAGQARNLGASPQQIKAAISSGENGLPNFVKGLTKYSAAKGGGTLSFSEVDTLVEGAELFEEGDVKEFLERSYGLLANEQDMSVPTDERTTFQKLLAVDPKKAARVGYDPNRMSMIELARQDAYDSLASDRASVYLTVDQATANVYDPVDTYDKYLRQKESALSDLRKTELYKKSLGEGEQQGLEDKAELMVVKKFYKLYGDDFLSDIQSMSKNPLIEGLVAQAEADEKDDLKKSVLSSKLKSAIAADQGNTITEVKDGTTLKYNVDANGKLIGNIFFSRIKADGTMINEELDSEDTSVLETLKKRGFNFDTMYEDDGSIDAAIRAIPEPSFLFPGQEITEEVLPPAELGGQMAPQADERRDADPEIEIPETKVDPKDTPSLFDDIGQFFREGGLSGRAEKRRREEKEQEEAKPKITVYSTQNLGGQSFSVTPDGKVYINDAETGDPKSEVTDSAVTESVLNQSKERTTLVINTFVKDARDKGILNDKDKLLAYWNRFSGKNRLSPYITKTVIDELIKQLEL